VHTAQSQVRGLVFGSQYEFSLRLCNAFGRWSAWSPSTAPLLLELDVPAPARSLENGGLNAVSESTQSVKLTWWPFVIPSRYGKASLPPIVVLSASGSPCSSLPAEYQITVKSEDGSVVAVLQQQAPTFHEELGGDANMECTWLQASVSLEPHRPCSFEVRARLRSGDWGPAAASRIPPRLLPIAAGAPIVDLCLAGSEGKANAVLRVESSTCGFRSDSTTTAQTAKGCGAVMPTVGSVPATLSHYQLRSMVVADADDEGENGTWTGWPRAPVTVSVHGRHHAFAVDVPLHAAMASSLVAVGRAYVFSVRCFDVYDRATAWSGSSDRLVLEIPPLVPPLHRPAATAAATTAAQRGTSAIVSSASSLQVEWAAGRPSALLRWRHFSACPSIAVPRGMSPCLQRVGYRMRMERRCSEDNSWVSLQVGDTVAELSAHQPMSWEVPELDEEFEHIFYVSASWVDAPALLCSSEWSRELASPILQPRPLPEMSAPGAPSAEVVVAQDEGIFVQLRWQRPAGDSRHQTGGVKKSMVMWYQLQFLRVCPSGPGFQSELTEDQEGWCLEPPTLLQEETENAESQAGGAIVSRIRGLRAGAAYRFKVRIGDSRHLWSRWSDSSEAVQLSIAAPAPQPGEVLGAILGPPFGDVVGSGEGGSSGGGSKLSCAARLHWRPFHSSSGLSCIEYRIMMLEWSAHEQGQAAESIPDQSLLARLRRGDKRGRSTGQWPSGKYSVRIVGYVSSDGNSISGSSSSSSSDRLEFSVDQLRSGACCRFFVTARYSNVALEALTSPHGWQQDLSTLMQSAKHTNNAQDQSPLSRLGLWSTMLEIT